MKLTARRLTELRAAVKAGHTVEPVFVPPSIEQKATPPDAPVVKLSTAVVTKHNDELNNPITPLADALADPTVPNKYRIQARVTRIEPVPSKNASDLVIAFCKRCNCDFERDYCHSCNDTTYVNAESRWRMLVFLEIDQAAKREALDKLARARNDTHLTDFDLDYPTEVALLLCDRDAAFLPSLPDLHSGPNEVKRARNAYKALRGKVEDLLLGNRFNGERSRPLIDWSVMKYRIPLDGHGVGSSNGNGKGKGKGKERSVSMPLAPEGVLVWKVFGMVARSQ
jgi:hypothetical protein